MQVRHDEEMSEHTAELKAQMEMLSEEVKQRSAEVYSAELAAVTQKHRIEMEEAIQAETQHWQKEMTNLREAQEKALQDAIAEAELRANAELASLQKEMNERKGSAVVQCTSKWQRAMEELQERQEVEKKMAYNEGQQDREKEWQQAAVQITSGSAKSLIRCSKKRWLRSEQPKNVTRCGSRLNSQNSRANWKSSTHKLSSSNG